MPTTAKRLRSHWRPHFHPQRAPAVHQSVWHTVLVSDTCGYWRVGAVREATVHPGKRWHWARRRWARGICGADKSMGVVCMGAATSGPQFLRAVYFLSNPGVSNAFCGILRDCITANGDRCVSSLPRIFACFCLCPGLLRLGVFYTLTSWITLGGTHLFCQV
jgi:hypothetical protein